MKINKLPSLKHLRECFEVSEKSSTGLIWKERPRVHFNTYQGWITTNARFAGKEAGCLRESTRTGPSYFVRINYVTYFNNRIIFSLANNEELSTDVQVDHRDGNRMNNAQTNLRRATQSQNLRNRGKTRANTSGYKCVFWCKLMSAWYGKVVVNKVAHKTKYSSDIGEIVSLVKELRTQLHKEFTHHG